MRLTFYLVVCLVFKWATRLAELKRKHTRFFGTSGMGNKIVEYFKRG